MRFLKIPPWVIGFRDKVTIFIDKIDKNLILPLIKHLVDFLSKRIEPEIKDESLFDWKKKALDDFVFWLKDLPDSPPPGEGTTMDSCDLYTLLSEFSALRQEIKMQNREQNKTLKALNPLIDAYKDSANLFQDSAKLFQKSADFFKNRSKGLAELEERIRRSSEKKTVMPFLDIRDALIRGHKASLAAAESKSFFRRRCQEIEGIIEGYEMAIRRFDHTLALFDIHPVKTIGEPFDPKTMKAVDKGSNPEMEKGVVIEERISGFVREDEVLKTAEVVVNE